MNLSQAYIYITIYGESFTPNELTQLLELNPSDYGLKGDKRKSGAVLKECFWKYQLDNSNALEELDESLEKLERIFRSKVTIIKKFMKKNELSIKCFVVILSKNKEDNGVALSYNFINFLNELKATIEVDIYNSQ